MTLDLQYGKGIFKENPLHIVLLCVLYFLG